MNTTKNGLETLGIGWQVGLPTGWGTYGLNLCLQLTGIGISSVPFLLARQEMKIDPIKRRILAKTFKNHDLTARFLEIHGKTDFPYPILHALGNNLAFDDLAGHFRGEKDIGVVFFESSTMDDAGVERGKRLPMIITGSSWNDDVLKKHGLTNSRYCPQGIDPCLFHPAPRAGYFDDRFVVFSGGKLEYRKGQDIVVGAFREFHKRHPDALLMTAWHNRWPQSMKLLETSPHVEGLPGVSPDRRIDVTGWLLKNGLPRSSFIDLGEIANRDTPQLLREADVGLFTNRCEGGTNLVAMECMACGVPVILSNNTGHFDLISGDNCYVLEDQTCIGTKIDLPQMVGWGESSVDEALERLEEAYADRKDLKRRGEKAAAFMADWSWKKQVTRLVDTLGEIL